MVAGDFVYDTAELPCGDGAVKAFGVLFHLVGRYLMLYRIIHKSGKFHAIVK